MYPLAKVVRWNLAALHLQTRAHTLSSMCWALRMDVTVRQDC